MTGASVLILGGGVGGLVTAVEVRRRLGEEHRVTLVDRTGQHVFSPSFPWLMTGTREASAIVRDLGPLAAQGIALLRGSVRAIDPVRRSAVVDGEEVQGDFLIIALGAQLAPEQVPGLAAVGPSIYSLEGAVAAGEARHGFTRGRLAILVAATPFKCPAAPYETAMLFEYDARKRRFRDRIEITLYTPEPGPMPVAGPEVSAGVQSLLEERGVRYVPRHRVAEVDAVGKELRFTDGTRAPYDWLLYVAPHVAPTPVREAGLVNESGWVPVDRHTLQTRYRNVYAIGDVTSIPLANSLPLPKAGVFAHRQAEVVAANIAATITGREESARFDGHGECFIEAGEGRAALGRGDFYAEPNPRLKLYSPGRHWHAGKVFFERDWLRRWL